MDFIKSAVKPENSTEPAYYFCFLGEDVLLEKNRERGPVPFLKPEKAEALGFKDACFLGWLNNKPCYAVTKADNIVGADYQWIDLRDFYLNDEKTLADIVGYAKQIFDWNTNFCFCGRCAGETIVLVDEHARLCEKCQLINHPRISSAIITAIIKGDQILLARGLKFPDKKMYSVLAGFLEPGESLEDCVKREVLEEVGIQIKNVAYFKSQSWPFPNSLMIGFTAEYQSGAIQIDEKEIAEAGWFKANALPNVPNRRSLSSELIQWFVENSSK